jgi:hypothetical protein
MVFYHGCTEGANNKFKIKSGMEMLIIKAKSENNLLMYYLCELQSFFFVVISPDII